MDIPHLILLVDTLIVPIATADNAVMCLYVYVGYSTGLGVMDTALGC